MKKFMTMMLGLSLVLGAATIAMADDKMPAPEKKGKKKGKKKTDDTTKPAPKL